MNYSSQPDSLFLNLQASPIIAVLSLVFFLFVASVGNLQKKLRLDLSDSFYVLLKSILLLPWGLSLLLQLSRTDFTFKNLQTIFAVLLLIPFFFVIPVWASVRADRRNHRSLASRHWLSMFTRVTVTLTLGLLSNHPFW